MRLLVVEDDADIAQSLQAVLKTRGCVPDAVDRLDSAWALLTHTPFDAVLLDLGLADGDGLTLLKRLRQRSPQAEWPCPDLPVLIMTARDAVADRVKGLDAGADDYVVKPFDTDELMARLRSAVRRRGGSASPVLTVGDVVLDPARHRVMRGQDEVPLGPREFALLAALMRQKGRVMQRSQLESALYGFDDGLESNAIEVHVHHLRRKLGEGLIRTVRGVGYFVPDQE